MTLPAHCAHTVAAAGAELLLYVLSGEAILSVQGESRRAGNGSAVHAVDGDVVEITSSGAPVVVLQFSVPLSSDRHAPLGRRQRWSSLSEPGREAATSDRTFEVLLGPAQGCCLATLFVGVVPPGAAPWHFHQYAELMVLLSGSTTFHDACGMRDMKPGDAVFIPSRALHVNENPGCEPVLVLGLLLPASSPSATYLPHEDTAVPHAIARHASA
ncbi:cupin domain-containing protein [Kineococcus sp. SYSU DK003]|uniref:cupin domain-containing protein n=1 Tax=Kineococcus sp. SYSU DK003 TaxID=3383124 RepID=UPI003D7D60B7